MNDYSGMGRSRLIAEIESANKHWLNESNNVQVLLAELKKTKSQNDDLRRIMRMAAGKLRSHAIAQPDRAWEKIHDALGLLDHGNRSPENPS